MNRRMTAASLVAIVALAWANDSQAGFTTGATNNITVQPAGPRQGTNGLRFLDVEGSTNGSFASFGVIDFAPPTGTVVPAGQVATSLSLALTQANASFTNPGSLAFYLTQDTTTNDTQTGSPLTYQTSDVPNGIGTQLSPRFLLGTGAFTATSSSPSGTVDTFSFNLSGGAQTYLTNEVNGAGDIRIIVAANDATVAATYAGFANTTATTPGPALTVNFGPAAVPEPSSVILVGCGLVAAAFARRRLAARAA